MGGRTGKASEVESVDFVENHLATEANPYANAIDYEVLRLGARPIQVVTEREYQTTAEMEAFMQERLVIVVHKGTDKNASPRVPVGLNGEKVWLPRDVPIKLPRRLVAVLAQSQEATFDTVDNPDPSADEGKIIKRRNGQTAPFAVLHDPNPRGAHWLRRVTKEA
jgi:hypothetical protein